MVLLASTGGANPGFWGPITAGMDWCEPNYALLSWVAEFFNTVSSLILLGVGLLGAWMHRRLGLKITAVFFSLAVIGLGSTAFHATLRFAMQLMDELPMLWAVLAVLYLCADAHTQGKVPVWVKAGLLLWGGGTTVAMPLVPREYEFAVFFPSFFIAQWTCIFAAIPLYRRHAERPVRRAFWIGVVVQCTAFVCWLADLGACEQLLALPYALPNPQLHAWWHALVSVSTYHWMLVAVVLHGRAHGRDRRLTRWRAMLPVAEEGS